MIREAFAKTHLLTIEMSVVTSFQIDTDNAVDNFRRLTIGAAYEEAATLITTEMCALRDCDGRSPLEIAIRSPTPLSTIQRILEVAPELARENSCYGYPMLQELFRYGHTECAVIAPLLLAIFPEGIAAKDSHGEIPIFMMVRTCPDLEMFRVLHAAAEAIGFDDLGERNVTGDTLLHVAVTYSAAISVAIVQIRRETRDAVNLRGLRPFHTFCFSETEFSENDALHVFNAIYDQWASSAEFPDLYHCAFVQRAVDNRHLHLEVKQWIIDDHQRLVLQRSDQSVSDLKKKLPKRT
jgi:hypothetical protein